MEQLEDKLDSIRWFSIDRLSWFGIGEASGHLASILSEVGFAVGQLSVFGAALTFSILYGAQRGDLWYIYVSWWLFLGALVIVGALSVAGAGSDPASLTPTRAHWTKRAIACFLVLTAFASMVAGLAFLAMCAANFDVTLELQGEAPKITAGPAPGGHGARKVPKIVGYTIIWVAAALFAFGLVAALRPRFRGHKAKKRLLRQRFFSTEQELQRRHRAYSYDDDDVSAGEV
jgi:hypothetical protein